MHSTSLITARRAMHAALVGLAIGASWPAQAATFTLLGSLGGNSSGAGAINNAGQIVGSSNTAAGDSHATLWNNGLVIDLGTLGGTSSSAAGINDAGVIVGSSTTPGNAVTHATRWSNGVATDLGTLGGPNSSASDINNAGVIVGTSDRGVGGQFFAAVAWSGSTPTAIGATGFDDQSFGYAINNSGTMAGWNRNGGFTAAIWNGRIVTTLNQPYSGANDLNDVGQVVGFMGLTSTQAMLWQGGTATSLGTLGGSSQASAINNAGQIVGYSTTSGGTRAWLWQGGVMTDLNSLLDPATANAGWVLDFASDINDAGLIVGSASNTTLGIRQAFVMTAVPEPRTLWMLLSGMVVLLLLRGGRRWQQWSLQQHFQHHGAAAAAGQ